MPTSRLSSSIALLLLAPAALASCLPEEVPVAPGARANPPAEMPAPAMPGGPAPAGDDEGPFVPVYRTTGGATGQKPEATGPNDRDFYLAIKKDEIGKPWFLSTYLTQSTFGVFAQSLGTAVVSFKVQNDKLFIFRAERGLAASELLQPEYIIEAYPLVTGAAARAAVRDPDAYHVFDPAAGNNRISVLGSVDLPIDIKAVFSQRFRRLSDGVAFEQVWTGDAVVDSGDIERVSGTLSLALRRYAEGEGFVPMPLPAKPFYFASTPQLVKDEGRKTAFAVKWNMRRDRPIVWAISPLAEQVRKDPRLADIDFAAAIKTGIESWNQVFGWKALEARMAKPEERYGDDDVNYFAFDSDRKTDFAFANFRHNPNTGEILGASVYFPLGRIEGELPALTAAANERNLPPRSSWSAEGARTPKTLAWGERVATPICDLGVHELGELFDAATGMGGTPKDIVQRYVAAIAAHEVGHTLGLRHNFKGSLSTPSASVMEYLPMRDKAALGATPGSYDVAAIRYLYGLSPTPPTEAFCTDEQVALDPTCRRWDRGADPLADFYTPYYQSSAMLFLSGVLPVAQINFIDLLVPHLRGAEDPATRARAYATAIAPLRLPIGEAVKADRRDLLTKEILERLLARPLPETIMQKPERLVARKPAAPVLELAIADLAAVLVDAQGPRHMAVRRAAADLLHGLQDGAALAALHEAHKTITGQLTGLTGARLVDTQDLLARIQRHTSGYYAPARN